MSFELLKTDRLEEYNSEGFSYIHRETGCQVYHVKNDDPENLFAFIFTTPPEDNCGTAHIMEHSVLAGSESFPVKDPFLHLMKSSVYTFLNAMTYPDRTLYPASSVVPKDYFNLMKVYGDAVFFPLLRKETFMQEGIRQELNKEGKPEWQGVVYNEMKGNYSEQGAVLDEYSNRILFPDTAFRFDSGGDPDHIPELTYEKFKAFHRRCYHPSNCRIFLYGNIDTRQQLDFIEKEFLCRFDGKQEKVPPVPLQEKYDRRFRYSATFPAADGVDEGSASVNWLCGESTDPEYLFKLRVLSDILLDNPSSLLYRRIVESDIAEDVSSVTGISSCKRQSVCSVGVRGIDKERIEEFEKFIFDELADIASETVPAEVIEAAFSKLDFRMREKHSRFGLALLQIMVPGWIYCDSPTATMCLREAFENVRKEYAADPELFNRFIKSELLENRHYSVVSVFPEEEGEENASGIPCTGDSEDDMKLFEEYKEREDSPENLALIPMLRREDISVEPVKPEFEKTTSGRDTFYTNHIFTGGIVYTDIFFDVGQLSDRYLSYIPLLCALLEEAGLPGLPYYKVAAKMDNLAGRWFVSTCCESCMDGSTRKMLMVRFASLEEKVRDSAAFMAEILKESCLDDMDRIKAVITGVRNDLKEEIFDNGHFVAEMSASGRLSESSHVFSLWNGIPQLRFLEGLDTENITQMKETAEILNQVRNFAFSAGERTFNIVCCDSFDAAGYREQLGSLCFAGESTLSPDPTRFVPSFGSECYQTGSLVNYNARVISAEGCPMDMIPAAALSHILSTGYLWEKVRMEGGAYGASASSDYMDRIFNFSSYRDPAIESTYSTFREAFSEKTMERITGEILEKTVIKLAGQELKPKSPANRGLGDCIRDMRGITFDIRKKRLELLLKLSVNDIIETAEVLRKNGDRESCTVIAGKGSVSKEKKFLEKNGFKRIKISI